MNDDQKTSREKLLKAATRFCNGWQAWHNPYRVPSREEMLDIVTEDFELIYNSPHVYVKGLDPYFAHANTLVRNKINVIMKTEILAVGDEYCWVHDHHTWEFSDGRRFESDRYGSLFRRGDKICKYLVLMMDPDAFNEWLEENKVELGLG
ncbi:MAG: hypothetical protein K9G26_04925 [Emcibacter sp.]|nr:hypothetical protein [Emcibacter sp.]